MACEWLPTDWMGVTAVHDMGNEGGRDVLVVVDVQDDFTVGALGNADAAAKVSAIEEYAKGFAGDVVFTKDTHADDYLSTQEGIKLPVEHCIKGTQGWRLSGKLEELVAERGWSVYEKPTFGSVELAADLARTHAQVPIRSVTLVGFCTDICVVSNALLIKARLPEVEVRVVPELCAGVTPESHEAALATMRSCQVAC